jgi:hypothetical protein
MEVPLYMTSAKSAMTARNEPFAPGRRQAGDRQSGHSDTPVSWLGISFFAARTCAGIKLGTETCHHEMMILPAAGPRQGI